MAEALAAHSFETAAIAIRSSAERMRCLLDSFAHSSTLLKLQNIMSAELVSAPNLPQRSLFFAACPCGHLIEATFQVQSEFGMLQPHELAAALNTLKLAPPE